MSGPLALSPADVLRWALVAAGAGSDPTLTTLAAWPIYKGTEPNSPDNVITLSDTIGIDNGKIMQGERQEQHGASIRVRAKDEQSGYLKARALLLAVDALYHQRVTITSSVYCINNVIRSGDIIPIGFDTPSSKRSIFTVNVLINVRQIS